MYSDIDIHARTAVVNISFVELLWEEGLIYYLFVEKKKKNFFHWNDLKGARCHSISLPSSYSFTANAGFDFFKRSNEVCLMFLSAQHKIHIANTNMPLWLYLKPFFVCFYWVI